MRRHEELTVLLLWGSSSIMAVMQSPLFLLSRPLLPLCRCFAVCFTVCISLWGGEEKREEKMAEEDRDRLMIFQDVAPSALGHCSTLFCFARALSPLSFPSISSRSLLTFLAILLSSLSSVFLFSFLLSLFSLFMLSFNFFCFLFLLFLSCPFIFHSLYQYQRPLHLSGWTYTYVDFASFSTSLFLFCPLACLCHWENVLWRVSFCPTVYYFIESVWV